MSDIAEGESFQKVKRLDTADVTMTKQLLMNTRKILARTEIINNFSN